jgi:hypothetical protein
LAPDPPVRGGRADDRAVRGGGLERRVGLAMVSTYVRTVRTFHRRDCPTLKRAKAVHDWQWMDTNAHLTPVGYGRAVRGSPQYVQACLRCFPEVKA